MGFDTHAAIDHVQTCTWISEHNQKEIVMLITIIEKNDRDSYPFGDVEVVAEISGPPRPHKHLCGKENWVYPVRYIQPSRPAGEVFVSDIGKEWTWI